jgi:prevent-host-death family protein
MSEHSGRGRVGVRELRQNLSVYLDRVKEGETLEVTEHGRPVARLAPLTAAEGSTLDRLVADGRVRPGRGNLADLGVPGSSAGLSLSDVLLRMRDDERA